MGKPGFVLLNIVLTCVYVIWLAVPLYEGLEFDLVPFVGGSLETEFMDKKKLDMPTNRSSVLKKLKGLYISLDNLHKLANFKDKYKISESRLVDKALEEFFAKYE